MGEAACWEAGFARVAIKLGTARRVPLEGILVAEDVLEEVALSPARGSAPSGHESHVRAFLVKGEALSSAGLQWGDYVLVDIMRTPEPEALVLAKIAGRYTLQRASSRCVAGQPWDVVGAFVGIIRRRGSTSQRATMDVASILASGVRPPSRRVILRGQLSMLEETRATTRNPRLRRALWHEAERVRRQLLTGAQ